MRQREKAKENKIKITITINEGVKLQLAKFVKEADNPKISNSAVIEDLLDYALNDNSEIMDKLFPFNKKFRKNK